jgi:caffeoyl-CoA O-methyltransferase
MMTPERWLYTERYLNEVFGKEDAHLRSLAADARRAGLPDIAVSPEVGCLLQLLVRTTRAERAVEVGTLSGYSATWIARGLAPQGRLITIERNAAFADFAEAHFQTAELADRIEVRRGSALDLLPVVARELGTGSLDFAFIDAQKTEYPDYWRIIRPLLRPGAIFVADNVLGTGEWWIDDEADPDRQGADRLNRTIAADADFDCGAVPLRQGLLIARRKG